MHCPSSGSAPGAPRTVNRATPRVTAIAGASPKLTVVGDDDQSIYRCRGASLSNILEFRDHYPTCTTHVLTDNYRSTQPILDAAYGLIQHNNPDRLEVRAGVRKL